MTARREGPGGALMRPFEEFFELEAASGILLLASALLALGWANSPLAPWYFGLWSTPVSVEVGGLAISKPLLLWINDGLMAVFFFVVGLEIKREVLLGELAQPKRASLALAAAVGGMVVPAGIYALLNAGGVGASGWGVPMATDIAFALGILALLGSRVPFPLKVFVTAVAIVDDLGAVLVIALFYTAKVSLSALAAAAGFLVGQIVLNRFGIRRPWPYAVLGACLWVALLMSGVHATIAGVLAAFTIPARRVIDAPEFLQRAEFLLETFGKDLKPGEVEPTRDQRHTLHSIQVAAAQLETPLQRLEHALHPWVAFFVIPVFALANAGVALGGDFAATFTNPVTLGVILGLFLGKQAGIVSFAWLSVRAGFATLPEGVSWRQIWGASLLCGIGFTMSLFIAGLAFTASPGLLDVAKTGILAGSLVSGAAGALLLAGAADNGSRRPAPPNPRRGPASTSQPAQTSRDRP